MKKLMLAMVCASLVFVISGCKEKTAMEKAADAAKDAKKDAAAQVESVQKDTAKTAEELKK